MNTLKEIPRTWLNGRVNSFFGLLKTADTHAFAVKIQAIKREWQQQLPEELLKSRTSFLPLASQSKQTVIQWWLPENQPEPTSQDATFSQRKALVAISQQKVISPRFNGESLMR